MACLILDERSQILYLLTNQLELSPSDALTMLDEAITAHNTRVSRFMAL